jgi:MFS family permease
MLAGQGATDERCTRMMMEAEKVRRTLLLSILDGLGYSVMVGAGETYFIPYALFLGSSNLLLGLFVALPIFIGSLSQLFSEALLRLLETRKRVIAAGVTLQLITFVPIVGVQWLHFSHRAEVLLVLVCLYWSAGLVTGPSWSSLMGDLVPAAERGAYFARRNRYMQIATFASLVVAGLMLYAFKQHGLESAGFAVIFGVSALARLASLAFLCLHEEPPLESPPARRTLAGVREVFRNRDQRSLILYLTWMSFAVYLAAPFFSAFMLRQPGERGLGWSYVTYTLVNGVTILFKFVFLPVWGKASDTFGSRKCLVLSAWCVWVLPLFWWFPRDDMTLYFAVICIAQVCGGFAWAGHELSSFNFLLDSAPAHERPRLVASMNIVNGLMVFLGSSTGAIFVSLAPGSVNPFLLVFLLSGLGRLAVSILLAPRLREVRVVERITYSSLLFRVTSVRSNLGPVLRFFVLPLQRR